MTKHRRRGVALTYASPDPGDGAGAQVQRLIGIYDLSRKLGFAYVHTPISHLDPNPGDSFESITERTEFLMLLNAFTSIHSDKVNDRRIHLHWGKLDDLKVAGLRKLERFMARLGLTIVVSLDFPYPQIDHNPDYYTLGTVQLPDRPVAQEKSGCGYILDMHIRRMVIPQADVQGKPYERYLPLWWYQSVVEAISEVIRASGLDLIIRIHTDIPLRQDSWDPPSDISRATLAHWRHIGVLDATNVVRWSEPNLVQVFQKFGSTSLLQDIDPISAWKSMVGADLLVTGPSSFSFVGGLLRGAQPTISPTFWHNPPSSWLVIERDFHPATISTHSARIKAYVRQALTRAKNN